MRAVFISCCFLLLASAIHSQSFSMRVLQVKTESGPLVGKPENENVISFKGIPYAEPPIGSLRWKAPMPVKPWKEVKQAVDFGPKAMQTNIFGDMVFRSNGTSEDCLYLNIWKPAKTGKKGFPVLVYYYGGGFVAGDGSESRYDGTSMAANGIVAVTVNYRLGVFGFLSHHELSKETSYHGSGNYGLMDQALALKWVYENIEAFGGDPKQITIAGESAGSVSVSALMASPLSRNYLAGAIGESGSILGALPAIALSDAEKNGAEFASFASCNGIDELRKLSADSILQKAARFGLFRFNRTVDGFFFHKDPMKIFMEGEQAKVPLLAGWNSEESGAGAVMGKDNMSIENFKKNVKRLYGNGAEKVLQVYNPKSDAEVEIVARDLAGDRFISYSTWKWIDLHKKTNQPCYRYYYEKPRPGNKGAVHSAEIEYAMGNLDGNKVFKWTEEDYAVSKTMQGFFINFIKTRNPNGKGVPIWDPVQASTGASKIMHIHVKSEQQDERHPGRYEVMDEFAMRARQ